MYQRNNIIIISKFTERLSKKDGTHMNLMDKLSGKVIVRENNSNETRCFYSFFRLLYVK